MIKIKNNRWIYIIVGIIIMMCLGTIYSFTIFRLPIERQFNISSMQSGFPYMFSLAFYSLFVFLSGRFIERFSPSKIISFGGVLVGFGWILSAFATNIYFLTVSYGLFLGAGAGIVYGVPINIISKWFPDKKGLATGFILVGFGLSPLITVPIASYLVETKGVKEAFFILGISFLILIPLLATIIKNPQNIDNLNDKKDKKESINFLPKEMCKTKEFKGLYITFIFGTMIGLMIVGITTNFFVDTFKLSEQKISIIIPLFAVFNGVGRVLFGTLIDKYSIKKSMMISYILIIIAGIIILISDEKILIFYIIAFCLFWLNLGGWLAIAPTTSLKLFGERNYSKNYGLIFTGYGIGAILGVIISGLFKEIFSGYNEIFIFIIISCLVGMIVSKICFKDN